MATRFPKTTTPQRPCPLLIKSHLNTEVAKSLIRAKHFKTVFQTIKNDIKFNSFYHKSIVNKISFSKFSNFVTICQSPYLESQDSLHSKIKYPYPTFH